MLRVNTGIKPNAAGACVFGVADGGSPSRLGCARRRPVRFPERPSPPRRRHRHRGPRLIEGYGPTLNAVLGVPNRTPNNLLGDGVDANDCPFLVELPVHRDAAAGLLPHHDHRAGRRPANRSSRTSNGPGSARAVPILGSG